MVTLASMGLRRNVRCRGVMLWKGLAYDAYSERNIHFRKPFLIKWAVGIWYANSVSVLSRYGDLFSIENNIEFRSSSCRTTGTVS